MTDHVTWSIEKLIATKWWQIISMTNHYNLQGGQWMLMSGDHFSDFINHMLQWVMNAPRSSVTGRLAGQTPTAIDQTRRNHIWCVCLHGCSLHHLWHCLVFSQTLGILFSGLCNDFFFLPPCIHQAVFIIMKQSSKGLKNYTKWPLCNCNPQLSNERWYALDINSNVDSVVNHSTQKCRECCLNFNVDWTLLLRWELCGWCDRWLMGPCTPVMGWGVNIKCHLLQKIITLSSKDSSHKNIKSIIEKHYLFKYNSNM